MEDATQKPLWQRPFRTARARLAPLYSLSIRQRRPPAEPKALQGGPIENSSHTVSGLPSLLAVLALVLWVMAALPDESSVHVAPAVLTRRQASAYCNVGLSTLAEATARGLVRSLEGRQEEAVSTRSPRRLA